MRFLKRRVLARIVDGAAQVIQPPRSGEIDVMEMVGIAPRPPHAAPPRADSLLAEHQLASTRRRLH